MPNPIILKMEGPSQCSMCKCMFTDPINKPCGHNFCSTCITLYWTMNLPHQCPVCKTVFNTKPEPGFKTFSAEIAAHVPPTNQQKLSSPNQQACKPGEVPCNICTGTKLKAEKSCLTCLASYCETHLDYHRTALKRHQLIDPVDNLDDRICKEHDKLLELFCKTDQMCICITCAVLEHKFHDFVSLKKEYQGKKAELVKKDAEIQQMILEKQLKIKEMRRSVELSGDQAEKKVADGDQVFNALFGVLKRSLKSLKNSIREMQRKEEKKAECFIRELEEEISDLRKRSSELKQLTISEDHLHLLENFKSLKDVPATKNWTQVTISPPSYKGIVEEALKQMEEKFIGKTMLWMVQKYAVDVTLDPDTAHSALILSPDGKQISNSHISRPLPFSIHRFNSCPCVLAKQSFTSGRFYYEVQVKGKTDWDLGVVRGSINRKGVITLSPRNGFWTINLRNGSLYQAGAVSAVTLSPTSPPKKVGVYVDYEGGVVSFVDVDAASEIYSFTGCSFTERLCPYFSPLHGNAENSAPMIISPVKQL